MEGEWIKSKKKVFTPGGDPLWECSNCGCGEHVYGIESSAEAYRSHCPNCGSKNTYPWEVHGLFENECCKYCKYLRTLWWWKNYPNDKQYGYCCNALENDGVIMQLYGIDQPGDVCEMFSPKFGWKKNPDGELVGVNTDVEGIRDGE